MDMARFKEGRVHLSLEMKGLSCQGPILQSIVSVTSSLMTNSLTVVAEIFSNTLIFLLQKCEYLLHCKSYPHFFQQKNINVFAIFQDRNFNVTLAKNPFNPFMPNVP